MKKLIVMGGVLLFAFAVSVSFAFAKNPKSPADYNGLNKGKSNIAHLYLYQKDPNDFDTIIKDGAWGKMKYNQTGSTFDFVFNGHKLISGDEYQLIYYPDPWPGNNLICLGPATPADVYGNVSIEATVETNTDLPAVYDENYPDGAKIWLVKSGDVDCSAKKMTGWNPTKYLFEYDLIKFDDVDVTVSKLDLYQKDSNWVIVPNGASGELLYNPAAPAFNFSFTSQKLLSNNNYSLIYYADPWPGNHQGALIANGKSDGSGNLNLSGSVNLGMDLPNSADANYPTGAKIQLVLSSDYNSSSNSLIGWHPTQYLFENNLIQYDDTDVP